MTQGEFVKVWNELLALDEQIKDVVNEFIEHSTSKGKFKLSAGQKASWDST